MYRKGEQVKLKIFGYTNKISIQMCIRDRRSADVKTDEEFLSIFAFLEIYFAKA